VTLTDAHGTFTKPQAWEGLEDGGVSHDREKEPEYEIGSGNAFSDLDLGGAE
jgi:hypothetical protein